MPQVNKGESKAQYISRAVDHYIKKGYDKKQALAIAYSNWKKHLSGRKI